MGYCVYALHDNANHKVYVGVTSRPIKRRVNHGNGYRFHPAIWDSICKNGWESFTYEVIESGLTYEEASAKEQEYIAKFDSTNPDLGYNREHGGLGTGKVVSDDFRKRMSEVQQGALNHNYGKHFSEEHKAKLAASNRGLKRSKETCARVGKSKEKPVAQYSKDGTFIAVFDSAKKAAVETGAHAGCISKVCKHQRPSAGGYVWEFA